MAKEFGLKSDHVDKNMIEKITKAEVESKKKHLGKIHMKKGLTLWEVNHETGVITQAEIEEVKDSTYNPFAQKQASRKRVVAKENCFYVQALNMKNAIKKADKWILELIKRNQ